jgi:hypothetical protein
VIDWGEINIAPEIGAIRMKTGHRRRLAHSPHGGSGR